MPVIDNLINWVLGFVIAMVIVAIVVVVLFGSVGTGSSPITVTPTTTVGSR